MNNPSHLPIEQVMLPLRAVRLRCLNQDKREIPGAVASGFIVTEGTQTYLYTCWHVATGYNPNYLYLLPKDPPPRRCFLRVEMQEETKTSDEFTSIGGIQTFDISLYLANGDANWEQHAHYLPQPDLEALGLRVPFRADVVRLPFPGDRSVSRYQAFAFERDEVHISHLMLPTQTVFVVGFPYGYSAQGETQPTPVVLTRHIAANNYLMQARVFLLDGAGAEGMSGSPVLVQVGDRLKLAGIYTGAIFPDSAGEEKRRERSYSTSLGVGLAFAWGVNPLYCAPNEAKPVKGVRELERS